MYYEVRKSKDGTPGNFYFRQSFSDPITGKKKTVVATIKNPKKRAKPSSRDTELARQLLEKKTEEELSKSMFPSKKELTVQELFGMYIDYQKSIGIRASTYERNQRQLSFAARLLGGNQLVSKLSPLYIHKMFCGADEDPVTTNERLTRLRACLRWAADNELCAPIPIRLLPVQQSHRQRVSDKYYDLDDLKILLPHIRVEGEYIWYLAVKMLLLTGLRIGELISLEKADVDLDERVIHVNKTYVIHAPKGSDSAASRINPPKTFDSYRDIFIQKQLLDFIQLEVMPFMTMTESIQGDNNTNIFFHNKKGGYISYDALRTAFSRYCSHTGLPYKGLHALRHTHASFLAANAIPEECIANRLGHRTFSGRGSSVTSDIYMHVVSSMQDKWNKQLDEVELFPAGL